ncbi:MAG: hypothetical protein U1E60_17785 [Reyranellaceae bacterium]
MLLQIVGGRHPHLLRQVHGARSQIDGYAPAAAASASFELVVKLVGVDAHDIAPAG